MKNITLTVDEATLQRARVAAAQEGKSLSKFVAETLERRVGRALTQKEALDRFLAGPLWNLTDENGNAPSRDEIYDGPRLR